MFPILGLAALSLAAPGSAQTPSPTKIGVVDIQGAILQTKDGQKAASELKSKFSSKESGLAKLQNEIQQHEKTYRNLSNAMNDEAKASLAREIDTQTKQLQRNTDDAKADLEA